MPKVNNPSLLAMMVVRNEADRYLLPVLSHLAKYVDGMVFLDDASTDRTAEICQAQKKTFRYRRLTEPLFTTDESVLRTILWEMTVELEPTWILALDADELLETKIIKELPALANQKSFDLVAFPIYHFWGDLFHYRVDHYWNPYLSRTACLYRYQKDLSYHWPSRKLHCGRFPSEVAGVPRLSSPIRLFHLGYANKKEHHQKYHNYLSLDPQGDLCLPLHYRSILDPNPRLKEWKGERLEELLCGPASS